MENRIQYLSRPEVAARIKEYPIALVPVGSTEQHGSHLPLGTDIFLAEELCQRIADKKKMLIYPSINTGVSFSWRDIPGTVTVETDLFTYLLEAYAKSAQRSGINCLVFVNGHDSNNPVMKQAVRGISDEVSIKLLGFFYPGLNEIFAQHIESPKWNGMFHAGEFETSLMLAYNEKLVDMEKTVREYPPNHPLYGMDNTPLGVISKSGVFGDPTIAKREKGEIMFDKLVENAIKVIETKLAED